MTAATEIETERCKHNLIPETCYLCIQQKEADRKSLIKSRHEVVGQEKSKPRKIPEGFVPWDSKHSLSGRCTPTDYPSIYSDKTKKRIYFNPLAVEKFKLHLFSYIRFHYNYEKKAIGIELFKNYGGPNTRKISFPKNRRTASFTALAHMRHFKIPAFGHIPVRLSDEAEDFLEAQLPDE